MKTEQQIQFEIESLKKQLEYKKKEDEFLTASKCLEGRWFLEKTHGEVHGKNTFTVTITYVKSIEEVVQSDWSFRGKGQQATFYCNPPAIYKDSWKTKSFLGAVNLVGNHREYLWFKGAWKSANNTLVFRDTCTEITQMQFNTLMAHYLDLQNKIYGAVQDLFELPIIVDENVIPVNFEDLLIFDKINKYLETGVLLKEVKSRYGTKIRNLFNYNNELSELSQYELSGNKEVFITLKPYTGNTDFEPYITDYHVERIGLSWPDILYPIRNKLNCGVLELADKLKGCEDVYYTGNWEVTTSSYGEYGDLDFNSVSLRKNVLRDVNTIIKNHLKL